MFSTINQRNDFHTLSFFVFLTIIRPYLMVTTAKKILMKGVLWFLVWPLTVFITLMVLLYIPPVQNFICHRISEYLSASPGVEVTFKRVDLRFPLNLLLTEAKAVRHTQDSLGNITSDTILVMDRLNAKIQALPLAVWRVEIDAVELDGVKVNTLDLIDGMQVSGEVGSFYMVSHGVNLSTDELTLNDIKFSNSDIDVLLGQSADDEDESEPISWKISLHDMKLDNVAVGLQMPNDSIAIKAYIKKADIGGGDANLETGSYSCNKFEVEDSSIDYCFGNDSIKVGFDPDNISIKRINAKIENLWFTPERLQADMHELTLSERSGLNIASAKGYVNTEDSNIIVKSLELKTDNSEFSFDGKFPLSTVMETTHSDNSIEARFNAIIGKEDIAIFTALQDSISFTDNYPLEPLTITAEVDGTTEKLRLKSLTANLPGAIDIDGYGNLANIGDSIKRNGQVEFNIQTDKLSFVPALAGFPKETFTLPDSMTLDAGILLNGNDLSMNMNFLESQGRASLDGYYNVSDERYDIALSIDSLQLSHFLPNDSLRGLSAHLTAKGEGLDYKDKATHSDFGLTIDEISFNKGKLENISLDGRLIHSLLSANLNSDNDIFSLNAKAEIRTDLNIPEGNFNLDVKHADLYKLGIADHPLRHKFAFNLDGFIRKDSARINLEGGDLSLKLRSLIPVTELMEKSSNLGNVLMAQLDSRKLDHKAIRHALPSAGFVMRAGKENPLSYYLKTNNISFEDIYINFGATPARGINGRASIHGLHIDSLQLDTISIALKQDTSRLAMQGSIANAKSNPQYVFKANLDGEIRTEDAELNLKYTDKDDKTGILIGINAKPVLYERFDKKTKGLRLQITPEEPIVAFRKFHFDGDSNWMYLHQDKRAYADIDMDSDDGLCFRLQSERGDTTSLQNMNLELNRIKLEDLTKAIPYLPDLGGLFSIEASYKQSETAAQVSAEMSVDNLTYEKRSVGNLGCGMSWLPGEGELHYVDSYMTYNEEEVIAASGTMTGDTLNMSVGVEELPLKALDAFIPDQFMNLIGCMNGNIKVKGLTDNPIINGTMTMDSVYVESHQIGARYRLDTRPVKIENNIIRFDKYSIYTFSTNPFVIDGTIDLKNLTDPVTNLTLKANNYTLIDAPKTRESLLFGKILVDMNATVKGKASELVMRGKMNVLGDTNATYVMANSPLVVEDRLDGLVTFVSFEEADSEAEPETTSLSLGGMDVIMTVHIDDAVRVRANLTNDGSKFVELTGGGDLSMQYTPQGDIKLTGRYTLNGGLMKYSLPIVPLKDFEIAEGSYVDWRGDPMNPRLNLTAAERVRASVADGEGKSTRRVDFDVSISITNQLDSPELSFNLSAPNDDNIQNELLSMGTDERGKAAITMLATGMYMGGATKGGNLTMGAALNSVLQSQINSLAGSLTDASFSVGIEDRALETGDTQTDYTFRYSQRFFNDRVQINIGGKVSTGAKASNNAESFIDNVSLEYRIDAAGSKYVRAFHNKNYENMLEGEVTETGVGFVYRKKLDKLSDLFLIKRKKRATEQTEEN